MGRAGGGLPTAAGASSTEVWARLLDTWEPFVRQTLDAQAAAMQSWVEGLSAAPNVPEHLRPQLQQVQELTRDWTATQRQMWDVMFGVARQFAAASGGQHPHPLRNWSSVLAVGLSGPPH